MQSPVLSREEELYWLALKLVPGLGSRTSNKLQKPYRAQSETNMGPVSLLQYDDQHGLGAYPLLTSLCPTHPTMRACYQQIMKTYHNQQGVTPSPAQSDVSGVRFMFDLADALNSDGSLNPAWVANVEAFFQDLYANNIYRITPTIRTQTSVPPNQYVGVPANGVTPRLPGPTCDPNTYAKFKLVRFTPTAPYGEVCVDGDPTSGGTLCTGGDLTKGSWDIDRASYDCAMANPYFVGWNRIYDVVDAMLQAARDNALTVEEFDAQNEIMLSTYFVEARLIVDNTNNNEDVLGNVATGLRSLRQSMQSHGFDPGRVTYSVMDTNPSTPNGECPAISPTDPNKYYQFGDSGRLLSLSMLSATIAAGGPFGNLNWHWDSPGVNDTQSPPSAYRWTFFACGAAFGPDGITPAGATYLPLTHSSPTIVDVHSNPCVVLPKYASATDPHINDHNSWGKCNLNAQTDFANVPTWANVQGEAIMMGNALAKFLSSRQQTDTNLANALAMLGETHGRLNTGCLIDPDASVLDTIIYHKNWDPSAGASTAAGFGSSTLMNTTRLNGLPASLVFRPWEYLQQGADDPSKPTPPTPQPGACNTVVTNPPYTPVR
jgi:hypothetical protein